MKFSQFFAPVLKEAPKEASITSHALLLKAGFIRQTAAGIYSFLPLGKRVLNKIIAIINDEMAKSGSLEVLMPTLQLAEIWQESGRYSDYGLEMLKVVDRHKRELIYGPTNEEQITQIFRDNIKSYKNLPLNLYQIQWKFRDEIRPRFGLLRGREFLMKDAYSFDISEEASKKAYFKMFLAYLNIFNRLGIFAIPMKADTGPIGGDFSHEFILLAETGESTVFLDESIFELRAIHQDFNYWDNLEELFNKFNQFYAVTEEQFNQDDPKYLQNKAKIISTKGIEVGQLFYFGTKYSSNMKALVLDQNGKNTAVHMGSYGIGVSRLLAAIAEANFDEKGIIWPKEVAPFDLIINSLSSNPEVIAVAENIYKQLTINRANHNNVVNNEVSYNPVNTANTEHKEAKAIVNDTNYQGLVSNKANNKITAKKPESGNNTPSYQQEAINKGLNSHKDLGSSKVDHKETVIDNNTTTSYTQVLTGGTNLEVIYNDLKESTGSKLNTADLIGIPYQLNIGSNSLQQGYVELKNRKTAEVIKLNVNNIIAELSNYILKK